MAIQNSDIKLMKSERLTDFDDGGGFMTGNEVISGAVNDLFADISSLDRIAGRVSLRKAFFSVQSQNTDTLYGAHLIMTRPPADPLVNVIMFPAGAESDERLQAADRLQAYAGKGLKHDATIIDDMFQSQTSLALTKSGAAFQVNQVIYIGIEYTLPVEEEAILADLLPKGGEYIKIKEIEDRGSYQLLRLFSPLSKTYPLNYVYIDQNNSTQTIQPTVIRETNTDQAASHYYGISPLAQPITIGDSVCFVEATRQPATPVNVSSVPLSNRIVTGQVNFKGRKNLLAGAVVTSVDVTAANQLAGYTISIPTTCDNRALLARYICEGALVTIYQGQPTEFGTLNYFGGQAVLELNKLVDIDTTLSIVSIPSSEYQVHDHTIWNAGTLTFEVGAGRSIVPGSVLYAYSGSVISGGSVSATWVRDDAQGFLYRFQTVQNNVTNGPSGNETNVVLVGSIDYATGVVTWLSTSYQPQSSFSGYNQGMVLLSESTSTDVTVSALKMHLDNSPLAAASLAISGEQADGGLVTLSANALGVISGTGGSGTLDRQTGLIDITFTEPVKTKTLTYNAIKQESARLDPSIVGIDALRLPNDGKVYVFKQNDASVIFDVQDEALPAGLTQGQVLALSRANIDTVVLIDQNQQTVPDDRYTVDFAAGEITMAMPLDLAGYTQPLIAIHTVEDRLLISEVSPDGKITFAQPFSKSFAVGNAYVASALPLGDLKSRVDGLFSQQTWLNRWLNELEGNATTAQYNDITYPIQVQNRSAVEERWALIFESASTVRIVGEARGQIAQGLSINADIAPVNPLTGLPYFTIPYQGWGGGWGVGNVLRFNTQAASGGVWFARCTLAGPDTTDEDDVRIQPRGDSA
jgi:hypothetical protein